MSKRDFKRIAAGFRHVAKDPTANLATVRKMVNEFCNAAETLYPRFDAIKFRAAVYGGNEDW